MLCSRGSNKASTKSGSDFHQPMNETQICPRSGGYLSTLCYLLDPPLAIIITYSEPQGMHVILLFQGVFQLSSKQPCLAALQQNHGSCFHKKVAKPTRVCGRGLDTKKANRDVEWNKAQTPIGSSEHRWHIACLTSSLHRQSQPRFSSQLFA